MDTDEDQLANANMFGDDHKPTIGPLEAQARALLSQPALTDQRRAADLLRHDRMLLKHLDVEIPHRMRGPWPAI